MNVTQGSSNENETLVAPSGGVISGEPLMIESKFCIPLADADEGDLFAALVKGEAAIASETDAAWSDGEPVYWDAVGEYASITPGDGLFFIGKAKGAKAETAASGRVNFDGIMATAGYVGDIQGVTAGTGLTGGGTSGTVTVALSTGSIASLGLADTAVQPGAELTDGTLPVADAEGDLIDSSLTETAAATLTDGSDADSLHTHDGKADLTDLASTDTGEGASLIGIYDPEDDFDVDTVQGAIDQLDSEKLSHGDFHGVVVTIALGASSGASSADPDLVGGQIMSCYPTSGNDQVLASVVLDGTGAVTVTTAAVETAEATFLVVVKEAAPA